MKHKKGPTKKVDKQAGTGGDSMKINYALGSGSRPGGGKFKIPSSMPPAQQKIRG
jgi:hypothetical protein